jgi:hypothetical protein
VTIVYGSRPFDILVIEPGVTLVSGFEPAGDERVRLAHAWARRNRLSQKPSDQIWTDVCTPKQALFDGVKARHPIAPSAMEEMTAILGIGPRARRHAILVLFEQSKLTAGALQNAVQLLSALPEDELTPALEAVKGKIWIGHELKRGYKVQDQVAYARLRNLLLEGCCFTA